jgi:3'-phosphoadenosine 5'-phosphosulfate sulfotransferase (PAPS reductase)/FAD synthetase
VLVISGERAEESPARKRYAFFEPDRTDNRDGRKKRHVDRCRIIHPWNEKQVWGIIAAYKILVHPCYYLGYSRCSCKWCIFASPSQVATSFSLSPSQGAKLAEYEKRFGKTIHPGIDLVSYSSKGLVYESVLQLPSLAAQAISRKYQLPIFCDNWILPAGAHISIRNH